MKIRFSIIAFTLMLSATKGQVTSKMSYDFGHPLITDSSSTIIIPTLYETSFFSSNKLALWGNYYSNIIFYNFKTDSCKKLFQNDTYIVSLEKLYFREYSFIENKRTNKNITPSWVFYRVMDVDRNKNNKIDSDDPVILYVSDVHGTNLKPLTSSNENVVGFEMFEKQNMALIKIQRDFNNDNNFTPKDTDYYYVKLDLTTLTFGKKIELK